MQYQIIAANSPPQLEQFVNNEPRHAWQVTGGLITYTVDPNRALKPPYSSSPKP
jgi:hypothetical protein